MPLDLRAIVRDRMAVLGLLQADLGRIMAPTWDIAHASAVLRLMRWQKGVRDMTSDDLAKLLDVLGLTVTPLEIADPPPRSGSPKGRHGR